MTHPEELLADYVDGTLNHEQRAVVDTHLPGCATCRQEVDLARRALAVLATLEDVPVPFGVTGPVLAEAGRRFERRRVVVWERLQWAAGIAAAAALVLVVALNIGDGSDREGAASLGSTAAADAEAGAVAPEGEDGQGSIAFAFRGLEEQEGVDYDDSGILALAQDAVPIVTGQTAAATEALTASARATNEGLECVEASGAPTVGDPRDTLIRLIAAGFEGTPAYIAIYAESPGAGQPTDQVVVWAVDQQTCGILTTASLRI
ncbi:MAG TPA: zf-HC2 domain-containing protein [Actinomycetota bacterium]|nr:zf-HC2 domain-containing protein [Actinomycetota bacterium]